MGIFKIESSRRFKRKVGCASCHRSDPTERPAFDLLLTVFADLSTLKRSILVKDLAADSNLPTLDLRQPGEIQTACGKGYWDCKEGEPSVLHLKSGALNVIHCESSDSVLLWNSVSQSFSEVWLSD